MRVLQIVSLVFFAICLPLFLISSNLRFTISEPYLYDYGFDEYNISETTGISNDQLKKAAKDLRHYFNSGEESAQIQVIKDGRPFDLFNQRELLHLKDVKEIIKLFYLVQWITLAYIIIFIASGFVIQKRAFIIRISKGLLLGAVSTLALFAFMGIWALIDFDSIFLAFHHVSFSNDLWILDPSRDYLIMMFPEEFFMDAALLLVGFTVLEAIIMGGAAYAFLWRREAIWKVSYMWHNC